MAGNFSLYFTYLYGAILNALGYNLEVNGIYNLRFFSIGVLLYQIYKENKEKSAIPFMAVILGLLLIKGGDGYSVKYEYALIFSIILLSTLDWNLQADIAFAKIVDVLDRYSFTIYLVHPIFTNWAKEIDFKVYISNHFLWRVVCIAFVFIGTFVGVVVVQYVVDKIRDKIRKTVFARTQ